MKPCVCHRLPPGFCNVAIICLAVVEKQISLHFPKWQHQEDTENKGLTRLFLIRFVFRGELQRCNNAPFVFPSVGKRTFPIFLLMALRQTAYFQGFSSLLCRICFVSWNDCNVAFVCFLFFQKANVPYSFLFPQKAEYSDKCSISSL